MTTYVLLPKLQQAMGKTQQVESGNSGAVEKKSSGHGGGEGSEASAEAGEGGHGSSEKASAKSSEHGGRKSSVPLKKVIVNIAGTSGTRYLLGSFTLVGTSSNFKAKIEENQDQLVDLASGILAAKTIPDIEKPGIRNILRNELISAFNGVLGSGTVTEIYITEFAVQ